MRKESPRRYRPGSGSDRERTVTLAHSQGSASTMPTQSLQSPGGGESIIRLRPDWLILRIEACV